ncbi:Mannosylfructose-phosphate synthase [Geodia barretti]|uniref:Mannosylfructose-phosphate synthase n=1 Tax=Geodia barretti TaxID=519541 RepID=A0AA35RCP0_GEOBA|nr:Mannosylfructose-phosphate synthase [Geodia barretti]
MVLVGREEDAEEELRAQARAAGLEDEIVFAGEVDDEDLGNWYEESDVFALFSQYEAFGLVYFEAMLVGLPVLTHEVGANRELLTQGARVVPRFDKEAAVSELVRLVNDEEHRRQLSEEAQEYALKEFTWSVVADKYLAVYRGDEAGGS